MATKTWGRTGKSANCSTNQASAFGNPGDVRPVGEGISELRIHYGPGYRVYYIQRGAVLVILLCGGNKSTQSRDIETARELAKEVE